MDNDRIYKYQRIENLNEIQPDNTFIPVDNGEWKKKKALSIKQIGDTIQIVVEDDIRKKNVQSLQPTNIEKENSTPPHTIRHVEMTYISVDENYLYIWVPTLSKWKRIPLSDWI